MMPLLDMKHLPQGIIVSIPLAHFFILFGYKLFSLYFPLFLLEKGFSLLNIGYAYLLIYGSIAIVSPLLRKIFVGRDAVKLMQLAFLGFVFYSLGMIISRSVLEIFVWQVVLGVSSATFHLSSRLIISETRDSTKGFSYFYAMPFIASFLAPLVGGILIVLSGFTEAFIFSISVYLSGIVFLRVTMKRKYIIHSRKRELEYVKKVLKGRWSFVLAFTVALVTIGIYRSFFVVFLERVLELGKPEIVGWMVIGSLLLCLISLKTSELARRNEKNDIFVGNLVSGVSSVVIALSHSVLVLFPAFLFENMGRWLSETGKSGFLAKNMKKDEEAAATIDTLLTSFCVALGSLIAGIVSEYIGIRPLFAASGILLIFSAILIYKKIRRKK
jgi:predicted MFS family arabinose efflux permease